MNCTKIVSALLSLTVFATDTSLDAQTNCNEASNCSGENISLSNLAYDLKWSLPREEYLAAARRYFEESRSPQNQCDDFQNQAINHAIEMWVDAYEIRLEPNSLSEASWKGPLNVQVRGLTGANLSFKINHSFHVTNTITLLPEINSRSIQFIFSKVMDYPSDLRITVFAYINFKNADGSNGYAPAVFGRRYLKFNDADWLKTLKIIVHQNQ